MKSVFLVPSYPHVPGSKFRRHGHLRLPLTMLAVASLALSSLLFLAPIPVQADAPTVTTGSASDVGQTTARLNGSVTDLGTHTSFNLWFRWGETGLFDQTAGLQEGVTIESEDLPYDFSATITNLDPNTEYNFRAHALGLAEPNEPGQGTPQTFITDAAETYTLEVTSSDGGSVTEPNEAGSPYTYDPGTEVHLVAQPNLFWGFTEWTGSGVDADAVADPDQASTTIIMNADYAVHANFAWRRHTLTIDSTEGGSVIDPGEGDFTRERDTVVALLAEPEVGYEFQQWTGDFPAGQIGDASEPSTTITVRGNYSITANFVATNYTLTIDSTEGGSVTTPGEGTFGPFGAHQQVSLVAAPDAQYSFYQWVGNTDTMADNRAAQTTITMDGNYSITAEFINIRYTLTIAVGDSGGGTTLPAPGVWTEEYVGGEEARVEAIPETGYRFDRWEGDVEGIDPSSNRIAFIMYSDHTITAHFAQQYSLTIDVSPADDPATPEHENLGWPDLDIGTHWYDPGEEVTFSASPVSGCQFDEWTGDVGELEDPNAASATIIMNGNYSFTANFSRLPPVETFFLYVHVEGEGSTNPEEGRHYFNEGELINIAATPADGWAFGGWTSNDEDAVDAIDDVDAAETTITMNYNYHVTANFVQGLAYDQMVATSEDTPVEIILTASNLGGDALTFSIVDAPAHGQLSGTPPNLTYTPNEGYNGPDSFTFRVTDGTNHSNTATVTITVEAAGTRAENDSDGMGVSAWVWILLAGGSIAVGAIALLVIARRSAATE